jgi:hypothetical protein
VPEPSRIQEFARSGKTIFYRKSYNFSPGSSRRDIRTIHCRNAMADNRDRSFETAFEETS